jgi:hypothetical protein
LLPQRYRAKTVALAGLLRAPIASSVKAAPANYAGSRRHRPDARSQRIGGSCDSDFGSLCCDGAAYAGGQRTTPRFAMNVAMASCSGVSRKTVIGGLFLGRKLARGAPYRRAGKMLIGAAVNYGNASQMSPNDVLNVPGIGVKQRKHQKSPALRRGSPIKLNNLAGCLVLCWRHNGGEQQRRGHARRHRRSATDAFDVACSKSEAASVDLDGRWLAATGRASRLAARTGTGMLNPSAPTLSLVLLS